VARQLPPSPSLWRDQVLDERYWLKHLCHSN
jgi:hypothetical protein